MLRKKAARALLTAGAFLAFVALPLFAQGIERMEYTGLDKYPTQGREQSSSFVGVRAAEFLTIPVGARGIGMGSAYAAVCDDITSIWWNPAGLGFLENREIMANVVDYTMDLVYNYFAGATPIADGRATVGGFFGYLDIPDEEVTSITSPNGTGSFYNAYDFQMGGSFAYHLSDRFIAGISVKFIHQDVLNNISGSAFGIDAGGIYHSEFMDREIRFAFAIQNLGTNITMRGDNLRTGVGPETMTGGVPDGYGDYTTDPYAMTKRSNREVYRLTHTYRLPTSVKIAVAYNLYTTDKLNWLSSGEIWRNSSIPISYSTGTEVTYSFTPYISAALRMGWKIQTDEYNEDVDMMGYQYWGDDPVLRGLSLGGGVKRVFGSRFLEFNYAYRNKGRLSADNFFTFKFGF
ncbi:MAG: PorV/PorQ family protein [Candidatus Glassbacteria bacterium]|nr:PorV/PorQ family protein [Candidatus Glassbacteria bacterium]